MRKLKKWFTTSPVKKNSYKVGDSILIEEEIEELEEIEVLEIGDDYEEIVEETEEIVVSGTTYKDLATIQMLVKVIGYSEGHIRKRLKDEDISAVEKDGKILKAGKKHLYNLKEVLKKINKKK